MARAGEKITLLNEQTVELQADRAADRRRAAAVGHGRIMGGEESGISGHHASYFWSRLSLRPTAIAGRARRYGFVSDASHRFERGVDFGGTRRALERATRWFSISAVAGRAGE
jgi:phenylalanyl-tRNA synthetase beta chain